MKILEYIWPGLMAAAFLYCICSMAALSLKMYKDSVIREIVEKVEQKIEHQNNLERIHYDYKLDTIIRDVEN